MKKIKKLVLNPGQELSTEQQSNVFAAGTNQFDFNSMVDQCDCQKVGDFHKDIYHDWSQMVITGVSGVAGSMAGLISSCASGNVPSIIASSIALFASGAELSVTVPEYFRYRLAKSETSSGFAHKTIRTGSTIHNVI